METPPDVRIEHLRTELERLRTTVAQITADAPRGPDERFHELVLKLTEVQLNLATQDRTLGKLDASVNGNGRPGLVTRVDRVEQWISTAAKTLWVFAAAAVAAIGKWLFK